MKTYNYILQGHEATTEKAIDAALGLDWNEIEIQDSNLSILNMKYFDTINGLHIYYDYIGDYYIFCPTE